MATKCAICGEYTDMPVNHNGQMICECCLEEIEYAEYEAKTKEAKMKYTLSDLAELVRERESNLAYGSETPLLGDFVAQYDVVDRCLDDETPIDDEEYAAWETAYKRLEWYYDHEEPCDNDMLWFGPYPWKEAEI